MRFGLNFSPTPTPVNTQLLQYHLLKGCISSVEWFCSFVKKSVWPICLRLLLGTRFCSVDLRGYPSSSTTQTRLLQLKISFKIRQIVPLTLFFFQNCFNHSSSFAFSYKFYNNLVYIYKILCRDFDRSFQYMLICISLWGELASLLS